MPATLQEAFESLPPIPEIYSGSLWWGFRPRRLLPSLEPSNPRDAIDAAIRNGDLRGFVIADREGMPHCTEIRFGVAWWWPDGAPAPLDAPPMYWFPKIRVTGVDINDVREVKPLIRVSGNPIGPFFQCSEFDRFLVPIVRDADVNALGVFADWLEDRDDPRAAVVGGMFRAVNRRNRWELRRYFGVPEFDADVKTLATHFGAFADATQS